MTELNERLDRMDAVETMVDEHSHILQLFDKLEVKVLNIFEGKEELKADDIRACIDFWRNYTDGLHHHKEELYLFDMMKKYLGEQGNKMVEAMLAEHRMGRQVVGQIEEWNEKYAVDPSPKNKLEVLANVVSYYHFLRKHIGKEDDGVFVYGKKNLPKDIVEELERKSDEWDFDEKNFEARKSYEAFVENFQ